MSELNDEAQASLDAFERAEKRRNLIAKLIWVAVGVPVIAALCFIVGDVAYPGLGRYVRGVIGGEKTLLGDNKYTPEQDVPADVFDEKVDLEEVHGSLLPRWLASLSYDEAGEPSEQTRQRFDALLAAVEADPNLHALVAELGELMHSEDAAENSERVFYLTWAWNDYLRQQDQPYYFEANMVSRPQGPMLYTKNYGLIDTVEFGVGDEHIDGVLARRVDKTNVVENYLCRATKGRERPLWVVDAAARDGAERVWPMLSADNDATLEPVQRAFAPAVRREAKAHLSAEAFDLLAQTAPARHQMLEAVEAINERDCNKFHFSYTPLVAYDPLELVGLGSRAIPAGQSECPDITREEYETLLRTAGDLEAHNDELHDALEELTAWVARPKLVHEVRHRWDEAHHFARSLPMDCPGCNQRLSAPARAELRGYLAGVAYSGAPVAGMFDACWVATHSRTYHKPALAPLADQLAKGQSCEQGPVDELAERAPKADVELFDRDEPIETVGKWPQRVDVGQW